MIYYKKRLFKWNCKLKVSLCLRYCFALKYFLIRHKPQKSHKHNCHEPEEHSKVELKPKPRTENPENPFQQKPEIKIRVSACGQVTFPLTIFYYFWQIISIFYYQLYSCKFVFTTLFTNRLYTFCVDIFWLFELNLSVVSLKNIIVWFSRLNIVTSSLE